MEEEGGGTDLSDRTDFFGGKHKYHRDADGLYTPPVYLYDQVNSTYLDQLANGPAVSTSDTQTGEDGTIKHFIQNGNERDCDYLQDRHGNRTVLTYGQSITLADGTSKNLLTQVTDPSNRSLTFTWSNLNTTLQPAWRITQVDGPQYSVAYGYNTDFNLQTDTLDPGTAPHLNRTMTFGYTSVSGPNGSESALLASISDPLNHTVSYQYMVGTYDQYNNFTPTPTNSVWVSQVTEPGSGGNHVWSILPGTQVGSLIATCSSNAGLMYNCISDSQLRFTQSTLGNSSTDYTVSYDSSNNVTSTSRVNSSYVNQPPGGPYATQSVSQWWPTVTDNFTYGPHGNVLTHTVSNQTGTETTSYYDADRYFQQQSVTDMNGHTSTMDYFTSTDANLGNRGNVKWVQDARYSITGKQFDYIYNSYGQKTSETNLNGVVTTHSYADTWGNLTQVVQDPGSGHLNRTTSIVYDVAGHVLQSTDPASLQSNFTYNVLGQPLTASFPAVNGQPSELVQYGYGTNGRTESVTDNRGTTTIAYETGNDRVNSVTDPVTGTVSYTYGLAGERKTMGLTGGGTWTYTFNTWEVQPKDDPNSLSWALGELQDDQNRKVDFGFGAHGELCEVYSNKVYDNFGNLTSYCRAAYYPDGGIGAYSHGWLGELNNTFYHKNPGYPPGWTSTVLSDNQYSNDTAGQRLTNQVTLNGATRTETYGYDELSRLTSVNYGDGQTQSYGFDPMGNRLSKTDNVTGNESYSYNNANMLLTRGANNYVNDADGNTLTSGGRTNTWDGKNRLVQCVNGGTTSSYIYGSDGFRHRGTSAGITTDYVLDGQDMVRELRGGVTYATYLTGGSGPSYRRDAAGAVRWYLYDGLGSVLGEVDPSGTVTETRVYDVYGGSRSSTGTGTSKHRFVGSLGHPSEDESGQCSSGHGGRRECD